MLVWPFHWACLIEILGLSVVPGGRFLPCSAAPRRYDEPGVARSPRFLPSRWAPWRRSSSAPSTTRPTSWSDMCSGGGSVDAGGDRRTPVFELAEPQLDLRRRLASISVPCR